MVRYGSISMWIVDLPCGKASRGRVVIRFELRSEHGIDIDFVEGIPDSESAQCFVAGEAIEAIRRKIAAG